VNILDNPNRKEILSLVKKKKLTIQQISNAIKLSYQNTFTHIKLLEEFGLVLCEKNHKEQGRPVYVSATNKTIEDVLKEQRFIQAKIRDALEHMKLPPELT
jgi:DNA-binding transcriptional ArsR family regulator